MNPCKVYTTTTSNRYFVMVFSLFLFFTIVITSCVKDDLFSDSRDNFTGTWMCTETISKKKANIVYQVNISKEDADLESVSMYNFYGNKTTVTGTVSGNTLSISYTDSDNNTFVGSGTYSSKDKNITFHYTVDDGSGIAETVNAVFTKVGNDK